ncbi:hypothetical protein AB0N59_14365 [Microbacterium sp. NPDC089321]|uniref:hypothetical protein n=1 Tax=Microbacterium sp. NPDC089321 TaxID=3155183 RepID=UPI003445EB26
MSDPFVPPGGPLPSADGARPTPQGPTIDSGAPVPQAPPPGAYRVPVGGYHAPIGGYAVPAPVRPSRRTGALALASAIVATLVTPIVAGVLALQIGLLVSVDELVSVTGDVVIAALSPARIETLWAEIMFWLGTALGIFAIVAGIIAIARRRGRGMGIAAIVIAALGPVLFFLAVTLMYGIGNGIAFGSTI